MESIVILRSATGVPTRVHAVILIECPESYNLEEKVSFLQGEAEFLKQKCFQEFKDEYPDLSTIVTFTSQICETRK